MAYVTVLWQRPLGWRRPAADCSQLGRRVTSATCADGCATAASGANRQTTSQGRRIPPRCNPNSPIPRLLRPTQTGSPILHHSPKLRLNLILRRTSRSQPARQVEAKSLPSSSGVTATAAADDAAVVAAHSRPCRPLPCLARVVRPEKRERPRNRQRLENPRQLLPQRLVRQRLTRPRNRRAR